MTSPRGFAEQSVEHAGRTLIFVMTLAGICLLLVSVVGPRALPAQTGVPGAQTGQNHPEWTLFYSVNRERAARGIGPLKWDQGLAAAAHGHALLMMRQGTLSHQFEGEMDLTARLRQAGARFVAAEENVAEGPDAARIHTQWMQSPPHRENLLDAEMNLLGVAVAERNGELFAVEDFSHGIADLSFEEQGKEVTAQLQAYGLHVVDDDRQAKSVCEGRRAQASGPGRVFSTRYATGDLKTLPPELLRELQTHHYRTAGVAACEPSREGSFSEYQIAVLLYE